MTATSHSWDGSGRRLKVSLAVSTVCAALIVTARPADAHIPVVLTSHNSTPWTAPLVPDGTTSFACYGVLPHPGARRMMQVRLRAGQDFHAELLIPDLAPENRLPAWQLPHMLVVSPHGGFRLLKPDLREYFYEPFTKTAYLRLARVQQRAEEGTYTLLVSGLAPSRFVAVTGYREQRTASLERAGVAPVADVVSWYQHPPASGAATGHPDPVSITRAAPARAHR